MQIFYSTHLEDGTFSLDENESRHLATVLRLKPGDIVTVINGSGTLYECKIRSAHQRSSVVEVVSSIEDPNPRDYFLHIAIAPTKNFERFEWFLEKSVEIGIDMITPIICERSERRILKTERCERIIISAMKQSIKPLNTILNSPVSLLDLISRSNEKNRFIAHCINTTNSEKLDKIYLPGDDALILIGPEGDFSPTELTRALKSDFRELSLGRSRLRTETAGVTACSMIYFMNQ